jgi:hypothetical protein
MFACRTLIPPAGGGRVELRAGDDSVLVRICSSEQRRPTSTGFDGLALCRQPGSASGIDFHLRDLAVVIGVHAIEHLLGPLWRRLGRALVEPLLLRRDLVLCDEPVVVGIKLLEEPFDMRRHIRAILASGEEAAASVGFG